MECRPGTEADQAAKSIVAFSPQTAEMWKVRFHGCRIDHRNSVITTLLRPSPGKVRRRPVPGNHGIVRRGQARVDGRDDPISSCPGRPRPKLVDDVPGVFRHDNADDRISQVAASGAASRARAGSSFATDILLISIAPESRPRGARKLFQDDGVGKQRVAPDLRQMPSLSPWKAQEPRQKETPL